MNNGRVSVELQKDATKQYTKNTKHSQNDYKRKIRIMLPFIFLWVVLVYGGYWYLDMRMDQMQKQINQAIVDVQINNNKNIQELNEKLSIVQSEMQDISWAMEQTGKELSTSGSSAREELNKRIAELDNRLEELTKSLEILKESKGEIN